MKILQSKVRGKNVPKQTITKRKEVKAPLHPSRYLSTSIGCPFKNTWIGKSKLEAIKIICDTYLALFGTPRCQFHQHFMHSFYAHRSQKCQMILLTWLSFFAHLRSALIKAARRTLMKLTPGGHFIFKFNFSW